MISILLLFSANAQYLKISGSIKDAHSEEAIPFASVIFKNTSIGSLTDSAGRFEISVSEKWPSDTLVITSVGYQPFYFAINKNKNAEQLNVLMERGSFNEGVTVKVKVNKGLLLWSRIVKHKERNNPFGHFDNFSYELYNKLEVDIKNIQFDRFAKFKPLRPISELITKNIDTAEGMRYLPVFLTEVISDYYYQQTPLKRRELIKAANTNGVDNESVIKLLGGMDQVVNIYRNFIPVFDKQFISPISDNGDSYYNYQVVDTQFVTNRKYYHLVFTPKRKGENLFEGDCWVHDTTFAIQKVNLRLSKTANINFLQTLSLVQEFKMINDSTWFIAKDKFVADLVPMGKNNPGFIGRKTTTYKNIFVNIESIAKELAKNKAQEETITLPGAMEKDKAYWNEQRHEELSKNEKAVISMIDTLRNAPVFQRFTNTLNFIGTGYLNVGNFQLGPWYNWFTANGWEGFRMRFDVGTNHKFNRKIWLHTYAAYGFDDKKWKGQAEALFIVNKNPRTYIYASYLNDLDFGQNYYGEVTSDNIFALAIRKPNIPLKYLNTEEGRLEFYRENKKGFSGLLAFTSKNFTPLKNLPGKDFFPIGAGKTPLNTFEISFRLRYAYLEKFLENNFFRTSLGSPYPITEILFTKGIGGFLNSSYNYSKITASVSDQFNIAPFGSIQYFAYAGKTFGTLPYLLLNVHPGNELYYYNKYAFNLMSKYEYISDRYAGLNIEHDFGSGIFKFIPLTRKLKFRQFWTAKVLRGSLGDANKQLNFVQGHSFKTLNDKTYIEVGTGVDNILRFLRFDFIWRVSPKAIDKSPASNFGVFGSIRVSF